ncbi:universal stress protein [Auraticoccus monumenti]|uniref:Nucleotide-binding universal stress protein, UspA family n=1 Tax=Auraticoccus monumenti TaxID=675864 RepID=A0A1G7BD89_9ACTN|nr:universal stress protein [Auraticoccus monumenti]SDE25029.1 Nucleotide-binding universal stress protein, UspA family [Auraticoccus monumenti]
MHVIVATDGSRQSLAAAKELKRFADPTRIDDITVVAVVSPLAAVSFSNDLGGPLREKAKVEGSPLNFRQEAQDATTVVMEEFKGWGPKVHRRIRSGSSASEITKLAAELPADLIVLAAGGRGLSETILLGSTATRVQHSAPCPVLVARPRRVKKA